ncbi:MAG TPA: thioesterase family protein [Ignavibacteriales bacterium]|nr:thioesterase family protein [Ignavibacteriales bacterium]HOL81021.1 thioesterase family protein [Ignavibacteriales bacterium]HOM64757.1 thioesterase family protein [Ignavibacteriales bacterium]HPD66711.1 thioesterase family protein [Ignavibacteriales bacterium]HPP32801.1 thioesterase family protein [Ignavibacteriales bacterium]
MLKIKIMIRVRYGETDQMGVVYNANYIRYLEIARTELLRKVGLPYKEIEKMGYQLPVYETFIRHKQPAHYDDILTIEATYKELHSPVVHIDYVVYRNEHLILEGYTKHPFINKNTYKPTRPPEFFIKTLEEYFKDDTVHDLTNKEVHSELFL